MVDKNDHDLEKKENSVDKQGSDNNGEFDLDKALMGDNIHRKGTFFGAY